VVPLSLDPSLANPERAADIEDRLPGVLVNFHDIVRTAGGDLEGGLIGDLIRRARRQGVPQKGNNQNQRKQNKEGFQGGPGREDLARF